MKQKTKKQKNTVKYHNHRFDDFNEYKERDCSTTDSRLQAKSYDKVVRYLQNHKIYKQINFKKILDYFGLKKDDLVKIADIIRSKIQSEFRPRDIKKGNSDQINTLLTYWACINTLVTLCSLRQYIWQVPITKGTPDDLYNILSTEILNLKNYLLNHSNIIEPPKIENLDNNESSDVENADNSLLQQSNDEIDFNSGDQNEYKSDDEILDFLNNIDFDNNNNSYT